MGLINGIGNYAWVGTLEWITGMGNWDGYLVRVTGMDNWKW